MLTLCVDVDSEPLARIAIPGVLLSETVQQVRRVKPGIVRLEKEKDKKTDKMREAVRHHKKKKMRCFGLKQLHSAGCHEDISKIPLIEAAVSAQV